MTSSMVDLCWLSCLKIGSKESCCGLCWLETYQGTIFIISQTSLIE